MRVSRVKAPCEAGDDRPLSWSQRRPSAAGFVIGLLGTVVVFGLIGPAIWLIKRCIGDRTPLYYRQERYGQNHRRFTFWKFCTMPRGTDKDHPMVIEGGARRTRFGELLSSLMLDELPQFLNLLRGDIRVFGPRPMSVRVFDTLAEEIFGYGAQLCVPQGLLSLGHLIRRPHNAPVSHEAAVRDHKAYFRFEMFFIEHRSWKLELEILRRFFRYMIRLGRAKLSSAFAEQSMELSGSEAVTREAPVPQPSP